MNKWRLERDRQARKLWGELLPLHGREKALEEMTLKFEINKAEVLRAVSGYYDKRKKKR